MMLTRCPACQTVFRLRPEQLHARQGEVRCGHCFQPFNALDNEVAQTPASAAPPASPSATPEPPPAPMTAAPAAGATTPAPPVLSTLDFEIPDFPSLGGEPTPAEASPAARPGEAVAASAAPMPEVLRSGRRRPDVADGAASAANASPPAPATELPATELPATSSAARAPSADAMAPDLSEAFRAAASAASERLARAAAADASEATSGPVPHAQGRPTAATAAPPSPTATSSTGGAAAEGATAAREAGTASPTAAHVDLARLDATYGRPAAPARPAARALAALGVLVLAASLLGQAIYLFRMEIGRQLPPLRPLLVAACARLGCEVPLPRDAEFIAIDASDLQSEPERPGRYLLHATVNNRASYAQAWPHLELTLTDAADAPIVRRVLTPAEWASAAHTTAALPPRHVVSVRLPFDAPGLMPTGYRLYVFYP